jgi:hypothetical protein
MRRDMLILFATIPLLTACGGSGAAPVNSASTRPPPARLVVRPPARHIPPPAAQVLAIPGLEGVIGASSADLSRQFGTARLDVWEGDARKLQFTGTACVLDVYLYPKSAGDEPKATYLEARRSDGREVDRAACVTALRKR